MRFWVNDDSSQDVIDLSRYEFSGLGTYAQVPYENCFEADDSLERRFDIGVLGAPHDTVRLDLHLPTNC